MSLTDSRGLTLTVERRSALERFETAVHQFAGYAGDPLSTLDEALAEEPDFIMGHIMRAGILCTSTEKAAEPAIRDSLARARAQHARANDRERRHILALQAWLNGNFERAVSSYGRLLIDYPRDLLALQLAHLGDFYLGQSQLLRDRIARVLPDWSESDPGYGFVLGMHAFGLEETADYRRAEDTGRHAVELNRKDVWAIHAVAHVLEMQGRLREGVTWLGNRMLDWAPDNSFAFHNWWHLALYHLDLGDRERVLNLYDGSIRPKPSNVVLEMVDATALLWRLRLREIDVGGRWKPLADAWEGLVQLVQEGYYAFNDVHAMMALLCDGRIHAAERLQRTLEQRALHADTNAAMTREVGLPVCRALQAFHHGRYMLAVELLMPVRKIAHRFGGSHAQRDVLTLTAIEAAFRAGDYRLARALTAERLDLKPDSPFNWQLAERARRGMEAATRPHAPRRGAAREPLRIALNP